MRVRHVVMARSVIYVFFCVLQALADKLHLQTTTPQVWLLKFWENGFEKKSKNTSQAELEKDSIHVCFSRCFEFSLKHL